MRDKSAYDTVIQAYGGFATNQADPATGEPGVPQPDRGRQGHRAHRRAGDHRSAVRRERGRGGQHVELSMLDAVVSFLWADAAGNEVLHGLPTGTLKSSFSSTFRPFRFPDGYGVVTPTTDADFVGHRAAASASRAPTTRASRRSPSGRKNRDFMQGSWTRCYEAAATLTTEEAMRRLEAERVPCGVVLAPADLADDPHAKAIGLFVEQVDPVVGRVRLPRHPDQFLGTPSELGGRARASASTPTRSSPSSASPTESTSCVRTASWPDGQPAGPTFVDAAPATARDQASSAAGPALTEARKSWTNAVSTNSQNCEIRSPLNSKRNRYVLRYVAPFGVTASSPTKAAT